jgi:hypothetical protein
LPYDAIYEASARRAATVAIREPYEELIMTIEILYLTAQIQRWLNMRVARHLAAKAEKLAR